MRFVYQHYFSRSRSKISASKNNLTKLIASANTIKPFKKKDVVDVNSIAISRILKTTSIHSNVEY